MKALAMCMRASICLRTHAKGGHGGASVIPMFLKRDGGKDKEFLGAHKPESLANTEKERPRDPVSDMGGHKD